MTLDLTKPLQTREGNPAPSVVTESELRGDLALNAVEFAYALNDLVLLPTDNKGIVRGLCRKDNGDSYLVVWWCESKRNEEWLNEHELRASHERDRP